jgi:uncharacterized phage-associated protein
MIRFDINRTIQAAAYLLKRQPSRCENYMRLLKLLYIADRTSLKERAVPISGDTPYAMARGPVFSRTLDLIKGKDPSSEKWEQFIEKCGYDVHLKSDPGNLHLSRADINILERIADRFRSYDEWALVRWCHKYLPEYEKNWKARGTKARCRIALEDVLSAIDRLGDHSRIVAEINADAEFSRLFSDHTPTGSKQEA